MSDATCKGRILHVIAHHAHIFDLVYLIGFNIPAYGTNSFYYSFVDAKGTTIETSKRMLEGHVASNFPSPLAVSVSFNNED
jgi:hypothetical protein